MIHKLILDRRRKSLGICDGKNDELYELCNYLNLSNVESGCNAPETVRKTLKTMYIDENSMVELQMEYFKLLMSLQL